MKLDKIKQLLDKYWEGHTSVDEENMIKSYFASSNVDAEVQMYSNYFAEIMERSQEIMTLTIDESRRCRACSRCCRCSRRWCNPGGRFW